MSLIKRWMHFFRNLLDPRPSLAKGWFDIAENYSARLRANTAVQPHIVEAILEEKDRIQSVFTQYLPEYQGKISIVPMHLVTDYCAVSVWKDRLYVLVSLGMLARPIDFPQDTGIAGWPWLVAHEATHVRKGHNFWLFCGKRLFLFSQGVGIMSGMISLLSLWMNFGDGWGKIALTCSSYSWKFFVSAWVLQTLSCLFCEIQADWVAARSLDDPAALEEGEKLLDRMTRGNQGSWFSLQKVFYLYQVIFTSPYPPFALRKWIFRRRIRCLQKVEV